MRYGILIGWNEDYTVIGSIEVEGATYRDDFACDIFKEMRQQYLETHINCAGFLEWLGQQPGFAIDWADFTDSS